jgi:hypothetical protein
LNDACLHDPFPTPFTDEVLENVGGHEPYSFTDGFSGYHHIKIEQEDRYKMMFAIEWGSYQYIVMSFGLKNEPTIFSRVVIDAFKDFIHQFPEVFLDDWTVYSLLKNHVEVLRLMLERCRQCQISMNIKKCIFRTPFGILLGHIVCKHGLLVDIANIAVTVNLPPPKTVHQLRATLGHRLLQEIYQSLCTDNCTDGKDAKKGYKVSVERRVPTWYGYLKGKNGHHTDISLSILGEYIPRTCRCISHSTWSYLGTTKSGGLGSPNSICE